MTAETKSKLASLWRGAKAWAFKYIGGLFMENKHGDGKVISIGRCMLIAILAWMFSFWGTWMATMTLTPEALALALMGQLPDGAAVTGVDVLAAAQKVVDAMPSAAPPMMEMAFLTACGYVFGTKIKTAIQQRFQRSDTP